MSETCPLGWAIKFKTMRTTQKKATGIDWVGDWPTVVTMGAGP